MRFYTDDADVRLAVGAIRSGKTFAASLAFTDYVVAVGGTKGGLKHIVSGRSLSQLTGEVLPHIEARLAAFNIKYRYNGVKNVLRFGDTEIWFMAWTNANSEGRFRGFTLHSALLEEATLIPESFFEWIQSRLSYADSRLLMTANPEGPTHWLKRRIDEGRVSEHKLVLTSNPWLHPDVIARYRRQYSGVFYRRAILGEWAAASGLVYRRVPLGVFDEEGVQDLVVAGLDFGSSSPTAVVRIELWRRDDGWRQGVVTHAWKIDASTDQSYAVTEQIEMIKSWFMESGGWSIMAYDPAARPFFDEALRQGVEWGMEPADHDVLAGISRTSSLFTQEKLLIDPDARTEPLREELAAYTWSEKLADRPIKADDHACDALRYAVMQGFNVDVFAEVM